MAWITFKKQRKAGFRFNLVDLFFIVFLFLISGLIRYFFPGTSYFFLPLYIGYSFFLFCNVFRIGNRLEVFWYVPFMIITVTFIKRPDIYWIIMLPFCELLKVILIVYRIKKGDYVGILYKKTLWNFEPIPKWYQ